MQLALYIYIYVCEIHTPQPYIYTAYVFTKLEMRVLFPPWEGQPLLLLWEEASKAATTGKGSFLYRDCPRWEDMVQQPS